MDLSNQWIGAGDMFCALEPRMMMSGDVTAVVAGANLVITGDAEDNSIRIISGVTPGSFIIEGSDGTTVNGESSATLENVRRNVRVNLKAGADDLEIRDATIRGSLQINTGNGDDQVDIDDSNIAKHLSIRMGRGAIKMVEISDTVVGKNLILKNKTGDQTTELNTLDVGGKAQLKLGAGADVLGVFGSTFDKGGVIQLGAGDDQAWIEGNTFSKRSLLHGGAGEDGVTEDLEILNDVAARSKLLHFELALGLEADDGPFSAA